MIKLWDDPRSWRLDMKTGGANFTVEDSDGEIMEVIFSEHYEGSWIYTEACEYAAENFSEWINEQEIFSEGWSQCEQHYSIPYTVTDPLKQLALLILKGDPQACDAARDILKS